MGRTELACAELFRSRNRPNSRLAIFISTVLRDRESLPFYGFGNENSERLCNTSKVIVCAGGWYLIHLAPGMGLCLFNSTGYAQRVCEPCGFLFREQ